MTCTYRTNRRSPRFDVYISSLSHFGHTIVDVASKISDCANACNTNTSRKSHKKNTHKHYTAYLQKLAYAWCIALHCILHISPYNLAVNLGINTVTLHGTRVFACYTLRHSNTSLDNLLAINRVVRIFHVSAKSNEIR